MADHDAEICKNMLSIIEILSVLDSRSCLKRTRVDDNEYLKITGVVTKGHPGDHYGHPTDEQMEYFKRGGR